MLQWIKPLALITISIWPWENSMTFYVTIFPLATVLLTIWIFPNPKPISYTIVPFSLIYLTVFPSVQSLTMCFVF
jgi:hypothetical protein